MKFSAISQFCLPAGIVIFATSSAISGEITLKNGDIIHGELHSASESSIVWTSELLGEISIPRESIQHLSSATPLANIEVEQNNCDPQLEQLADKCNTTSLEMAANKPTAITPEPEPSVFNGEVKLGYNKKSGNTDTEDLDFASKALWQKGLLRHEAEITAQTDKADGQIIDERYKTDYQLNYDFHKQWFSFGRLSYEKTKFSAIDEQYQLGAGIGHRLTLNNQLQINAQLGAAYLSTHKPEDGSDSDLAGRWALKVDWAVPGSELILFHHHELIWPVEGADNNQVESSTGLKMPLIGGVFSEFRYDFDYVNQPTDEQKHADQEWVVSLGYKW